MWTYIICWIYSQVMKSSNTGRVQWFVSLEDSLLCWMDHSFFIVAIFSQIPSHFFLKIWIKYSVECLFSVHIRLVTLLNPSAVLCFSTFCSINLLVHSSNRLVLVNNRIRSTFTLSLLVLGCPIMQRGRWIEAILLNMHSTSEDKRDTTTHRSYKKLKHVFD
jgi:hypothetical protein